MIRNELRIEDWVSGPEDQASRLEVRDYGTYDIRQDIAIKCSPIMGYKSFIWKWHLYYHKIKYDVVSRCGTTLCHTCHTCENQVWRRKSLRHNALSYLSLFLTIPSVHAHKRYVCLAYYFSLYYSLSNISMTCMTSMTHRCGTTSYDVILLSDMSDLKHYFNISTRDPRISTLEFRLPTLIFQVSSSNSQI